MNDVREQHENLLEVWLKFAPKPPERGRNSYDAFISYRSSDRAWAMALYDVLRMAGWEPFLDQFDLVPGADLEVSLSEALAASSAGVILWSSRTRDSAWCQRERNAMRALKDRPGSAFKYIFARLDAEELPLFAQADLYVDFADSPEGPRGVNLLRLLCGMRGIPLDDGAVRMANRVDEESRQAMTRIRAAIDAGNAERLRELGLSSQMGVLSSPALMSAATQGLIRLGEYGMALEVSDHALTCFPKSIRIRQLKGLALRRMKKFQEAIEVLSELKADGHQDPETLGILAAAWDGLYLASGKALHLRRARELYRTAFQADPKDSYTGINAAAKSLFLGEPDEAARLASAVFPLVAQAADAEDFWPACTLGEVHLLQGQLAAAAAQFQRVIDRHPTSRGDLTSTEQQARRICGALGLSPADTAAVLAPFALLAD